MLREYISIPCHENSQIKCFPLSLTVYQSHTHKEEEEEEEEE